MNNRIPGMEIDGMDGMDSTDTSLLRTCTQIASCAVGAYRSEQDREGLRAQLELERLEREARQEKAFGTTFRDLLKGF